MRTVIERIIEDIAADLPEWSTVEHCIGGYICGDRILWTREPEKPLRLAVERLGYDHGTITHRDPIDRIAWFLGIDPAKLAHAAGLTYPIADEEDAA